MATKQTEKQEAETPQETPVATPMQEDCIVTAVALVHKLEVEGMIYAKGTRFNLPLSKAKALESVGRVGNIGA